MRRYLFRQDTRDEFHARAYLPSDEYRSKLFGLPETAHPEAFDNHDTGACRRGSKVMREFLREHLKKEKGVAS
jgi:hypothetical protein